MFQLIDCIINLLQLDQRPEAQKHVDNFEQLVAQVLPPLSKVSDEGNRVQIADHAEAGVFIVKLIIGFGIGDQALLQSFRLVRVDHRDLLYTVAQDELILVSLYGSCTLKLRIITR